MSERSFSVAIAPPSALRCRSAVRAPGVAVALAAILGCGSGSGTAPRWTVLVYLDGDNSLAEAARRDLADLAGAASSPNVTVLVQLDTPGDPTRRYRVQDGAALPVGPELGELNMAAPATLTDFIRWGSALAPADHLALVLWDHGNGWDQRDRPSVRAATAVAGGVRADSIFVDWDNEGTTDRFTSNARVAQGIRDAGVHVDLLGFDACFMASFEALYEFRDTADVLVASEEDTPARGWDYQDLLSRLAAQPGMSAEELGRAAVESYRRWAEDVYAPRTVSLEERRLTLAAFRGRGLDAVAEGVDALAGELLAELGDPGARPGALARLAQARAAVQDIDRYITPGVYVDLADLARGLDPTSPVPARLAAATIDAYHGPARPRASGASLVFFRSRDEITYDPSYRDWDPVAQTGNRGAFINAYRWDALLDAYLDAASP